MFPFLTETLEISQMVWINNETLESHNQRTTIEKPLKNIENIKPLAELVWQAFVMAASHSVYFPCSAVCFAADSQAIYIASAAEVSSTRSFEKRMSRSFANWFAAPMFMDLRRFPCIFTDSHRLTDFYCSSSIFSASLDFRRSLRFFIDSGGFHGFSKILIDFFGFALISSTFVVYWFSRSL